MEPIHELMRARLEKRQKLLDKGIDPYGGRFEVSETIAAARANPTAERDVRLAGRLMSHRDMGKSVFADIKDSTGKIQIYLQKKALPEDQFDLFKHLVDLGDIVGVSGKLFTTHAGELTVRVESCDAVEQGDPAAAEGMVRRQGRRDAAAPAVSGFDSQRHGAGDVSVAQPGGRARSGSFSTGAAFIEVETPMMQPIAGGAAAKPFQTHHEALGCGSVFARRAGAVPETAAGGRLREGLRDQPQLPQRRHFAQTQSRSSRCSRCTRPTAITRR